MTVLLLHSPMLAAASTWGGLPARLGEPVVAPEVTGDDGPPYASRYLDDATRQARPALAATPGGAGAVVVLAHSGAGPLVPGMVAALGAAGVAVAGAVFLDAVLPPSCLSGAGAGAAGGGPVTRFDLLVGESAEVAAGLRDLLDGGGRFPNWTAEQLAAVVPDPAAVLAGVRPRGWDYFTEPLPDPPLPAGLSCGYVQLSETYRPYADRAAALGWPVARADLGHFGPLSAPDTVAGLVGQVRADRQPR